MFFTTIAPTQFSTVIWRNFSFLVSRGKRRNLRHYAEEESRDVLSTGLNNLQAPCHVQITFCIFREKSSALKDRKCVKNSDVNKCIHMYADGNLETPNSTTTLRKRERKRERRGRRRCVQEKNLFKLNETRRETVEKSICVIRIVYCANTRKSYYTRMLSHTKLTFSNFVSFFP